MIRCFGLQDPTTLSTNHWIGLCAWAIGVHFVGRYSWESLNLSSWKNQPLREPKKPKEIPISRYPGAEAMSEQKPWARAESPSRSTSSDSVKEKQQRESWVVWEMNHLNCCWDLNSTGRPLQLMLTFWASLLAKQTLRDNWINICSSQSRRASHSTPRPEIALSVPIFFSATDFVLSGLPHSTLVKCINAYGLSYCPNSGCLRILGPVCLHSDLGTLLLDTILLKILAHLIVFWLAYANFLNP